MLIEWIQFEPPAVKRIHLQHSPYNRTNLIYNFPSAGAIVNACGILNSLFSYGWWRLAGCRVSGQEICYGGVIALAKVLPYNWAEIRIIKKSISRGGLSKKMLLEEPVRFCGIYHGTTKLNKTLLEWKKWAKLTVNSKLSFLNASYGVTMWACNFTSYCLKICRIAKWHPK